MTTLPRSTDLGRRLVLHAGSALVLSLLLASPALAQIPTVTAPQADTTAKPAAEDPLGRSNPNGTVSGFLRAAGGNDYARAAQYLDTRRKAAAAEELAQQLKVVLDRGLLVDLDRLSRKPEGDVQDGMRVTRDRVGTVNTGSGPLEILVERVEKRGELPIWLFSSETLSLIPAAADEFGVFDPEAYLPRILVHIGLFSVPLYRWIGIILGLAITLGLGSLIARAFVLLLRPLFRRLTGEVDDRTLISVKAPIRLILISALIRLLLVFSVSLALRQFWTRVAITIGIIGLAWLLMRLMDIVSTLAVRRFRRSGQLGRIEMWTLARRLAKALVVIATGLLLLHRAGTDLTAILTGLGIGGVAFALAAQKTLENLFGGMMIISDEPMRVGDFCRVADQMGTVEDIGLRSTRIRTLSRTVVAIPNGQLASMNIENLSLRDKFWFRHQIGLRYETSADQLRYVLAEIRAMLYAHPMIERDDARIRFIGFGGSSLDLEIFAYVRATEMPEFLGVQEDLLLRIMDIIAKGGTGIAFPSQTTYLAKGMPLDPQKTEQAETYVRQWRERGDLPFPDHRPDQIGQVGDRIAYPPAESALRRGQDDHPAKSP